MRKSLKRLLSIVMSFALFTGIFSVYPSAKDIYDPPLNMGVMSDIHFFPESLSNKNSAEFQKDTHIDSKLMGESEAILKAALKTIEIRKEQGTYAMKYLLVPGDLTFNGEKEGHRQITALFRDFEEKTGIQIFVINGNHDVNNFNGADYATPDGKKITTADNPNLLLTTPEDFRNIYADFGYKQADSVFIPSSGKAGMLSYTVSLPGGFRLIAIDSCIYSADVTADGKDEKEGGMSITPELLNWVLKVTGDAKQRGETVIGMAHGGIVEHFSLSRALSKNSVVINNQNISYQLADAGMHFIFTGHMHANDVASAVSGSNEILYDIETGGLSNIPNTYREAVFAKGLRQNQVSLGLNNADCDAECNVDLSNVTDYGIIERPFFENYCMPVLYGGSVENGVRNDAAAYVNNNFVERVPRIITETFPNGLSGYLKDKGIDLGKKMVKASPALKTAIAGYNLSPQAFSEFLNAVVKQIDDKYIVNTDHTLELAHAAVNRFAHFEICEGNGATQFGKIAMLGIELNAVGNENPQNYPGIQEAIHALRTQAGADRFVGVLIDIVLNDILFDDILPSVSLNDLDILLPPDVMKTLRTIAGDDLTVGGIMDKILDNAAQNMNALPFANIENGRDLVKALAYTAGYKYLNAAARLKISSAFADIIVSFTSDSDPAPLSDFNTTLQYNGKAAVVPTSENYRLPNGINIAAGAIPGDVVFEWFTMPGIEGSDIEISPLPTTAQICSDVQEFEKTAAVIDFGFMSLNKPLSLLKHSVTVKGLEPGVLYRYKIGDKTKELMTDENTVRINDKGEISSNTAADDFFSGFIGFVSGVVEVLKSIGYILDFFI